MNSGIIFKHFLLKSELLSEQEVKYLVSTGFGDDDQYMKDDFTA